MRDSRITRRGLLGASAATGAFGLLAACGQTQMQSTEMEGDQPKAAEPAAEAGPKTQEVKLSVQDGGRWQPWVEGILNERFQAKYPNGEVVFTPRTGGQAHTFVELSVGLAAGIMPDLFKMGQAIAPSIYMAGLSIPLNSYFATWGMESDFLPSTLDTVRVKGQLQGMPMMAANRSYWIRDDHMAEAGLTPPTAWTMDDQADFATSLTKWKVLGKEIERYGFSPGNLGRDPEEAELNGIVESNGVQWVTNGRATGFVNGPEAVAGLEFQLRRQLGYNPSGSSYVGPEFKGHGGFAGGYVSMKWGNAAIGRTVKTEAPEDIGEIFVAPEPMGDKRAVSLSFNDWLGIGAATDNPDVVWDLLLTVHEDDVLIAYDELTFFLPPRVSVASKAPYVQENAFLSGLLSNLQNVGLGRQPIPGWDKMRPIILEELAKAGAGELDARDALDNVAARWDIVLQEPGIQAFYNE